MRKHSRFGAIALILVGSIFLLINLGVLPVRELKALLAQWWPLILILLGVWMLVRPQRNR
jgi:ABC-type nickel/cobalt efflux system permease component RcnA